MFTAGLVASMFGLTNFFARGFGGFLADKASPLALPLPCPRPNPFSSPEPICQPLFTALVLCRPLPSPRLLSGPGCGARSGS